MGAFHSVMRPLALAALLASLVMGSASTAAAQDDTTPPYFSVMQLRLSTTGWTESSSWVSNDDLSGVDHSTARWRAKEIGSTWGPWHHPHKWQTLPATATISKHFKRGYKYQIEVRVFDRAGNHTTWTPMGGGIRPGR